MDPGLKLCDSDEWRDAASMAPVISVDNVKAWVGCNDNVNQGIPSTSSSILEPTTALSTYSPETTSESETASTSSEFSSSSSSDKSANSQLKWKVIVSELELKDPSFSPPTLPSDSNIHAEFEEFQLKSKAIALATNSSLNFAFHMAEALALNGVWFAGKALLDSSEAKEITRSMRQEYHIPDFKEILDLLGKGIEMKSDKCAHEPPAVVETAIVVVVVVVILFPKQGCICDCAVLFRAEPDPAFCDGHAGVSRGDQEVRWSLEKRVWIVDFSGVLVHFGGSGVGVRKTDFRGGRGDDTDSIRLPAVPGLWFGNVSVSSAIGGANRG
ncbi:hypothetical protein BGZ46_002940 [Entomortierella lignicola]|nr:hypothetical protein BGZ46_002940 [Entomortierella lignicola]